MRAADPGAALRGAVRRAQAMSWPVGSAVRRCGRARRRAAGASRRRPARGLRPSCRRAWRAVLSMRGRPAAEQAVVVCGAGGLGRPRDRAAGIRSARCGCWSPRTSRSSCSGRIRIRGPDTRTGLAFSAGHGKPVSLRRIFEIMKADRPGLAAAAALGARQLGAPGRADAQHGADRRGGRRGRAHELRMAGADIRTSSACFGKPCRAAHFPAVGQAGAGLLRRRLPGRRHARTCCGRGTRRRISSANSWPTAAISPPPAGRSTGGRLTDELDAVRDTGVVSRTTGPGVYSNPEFPCGIVAGFAARRGGRVVKGSRL